VRNSSAVLSLIGLAFLTACPEEPAPPPPITPPTVSPGPTAGPQLAPRVELDLVEATLTDVARALAGATGRPIVIDPGAQDLAGCARITVIAPGPGAPDEVLALVGRALEGSGLVLETSGEGSVIRRQAGVEPPESCRPAPPAEPVATGAGARRTGTGGSSGGAGTSRTDDPIVGGIRRVNATTYLVTRDAREAFVAQPSSSARMIPHVVGGEAVGLQLFGIRASSPLGAIGLQNGDIVRTVNGRNIASPERALEAYSSLRNAGTFTVELERRGAPVTMTYRIVDRLP
jgi:general secretion pathway protein C